jgi:hypothetical protein|tara:strand:+ start:944 stop:1540 length:597 start_codon:yes stop_codon:yes gene_type:complete
MAQGKTFMDAWSGDWSPNTPSQETLRNRPEQMNWGTQRPTASGGDGNGNGYSAPTSTSTGLSNTPSGIGAIDVNSSTGAADINAAITREQWEDYKKRFQPYEDRLAAIYKNGGLMEGEAERIPEAVNQSFTTMRGIADRQLSRYGITPNEDQATSRNRMASLDQAIASVDAQNNLWATADERQDKIMTGGIDTMRQQD